MIIGISGKINSGKDTIGTIIQYLTLYNDLGYTHPISANDMNDWLRRSSQVPSNWEIRKFADKLKECISLITGISRADLEKEDVKNSNLPEDWDYKFFASPESLEPGIKSISVRELLQKFGTEVGRSIHPNFWVNALFASYHSNFVNNPFYKDKGVYDVTEDDELRNPPMYPNWIITDVRFPNELAAIKERGGVVIRVNRNTVIKDNEGNPIRSNKSYSNINTVQHQSETALDNAMFDYTVDNNGTIDDLIIKIREILLKEQIIK